MIMKNCDHMFTIFDKDGNWYLTAVAGGVAMYEVTLSLTRDDVDRLQADEAKAIALARDLVLRSPAYEGRLVRPALRPG